MSVKGMYQWALKTAEGKFHGTTDERDGKLYFNGTVKSVEEKNQIWTALKTVPDWEKDVVADITVSAPASQSAPTTGSGGAAPAPTISYTVQSGDTLSGIAKKFLGNANEYMDIFNANRDQLTDPDKIKPGQVLKIPQHTHR